MHRLLFMGMLVVGSTVAASAHELTPLRWPTHRQLADWMSTTTTVATIGADTLDTWRGPDRVQAVRCQIVRLSVAYWATTGLKHALARTRPDGSDRASFPSMHTALASASAGWRVEAGVPLAINTGYLRMAADKHYLTDVLAGAAIGVLAQRVC